MINKDCYLLTGANGFLGKIIRSHLLLNGSQVISLGRSLPSKYLVDLSCVTPQFNELFDVVIHSAGKAHSVPRTETEHEEFFTANVIGTENLLKGLENSSLPKSFIFISSVAVYGRHRGVLINEDTSLLATDSYGRSKIEAEELVLEWCKKNKVICTILRLPLIAGINPPGNLKAMINGIKKGYYFNIDGGKAKKSIVLAEDVAKIIPIVADIGGVYNLTDNYHPSFLELSRVVAQQLNKSEPINIPMWIATLLAEIGNILGNKAPINSNKLVKIKSDLTFDDSKAKKMLGWKPTSVLKGFKIINN